jgi:hypothetical protein
MLRMTPPPAGEDKDEEEGQWMKNQWEVDFRLRGNDEGLLWE